MKRKVISLLLLIIFIITNFTTVMAVSETFNPYRENVIASKCDGYGKYTLTGEWLGGGGTAALTNIDFGETGTQKAVISIGCKASGSTAPVRLWLYDGDLSNVKLADNTAYLHDTNGKDIGTQVGIIPTGQAGKGWNTDYYVTINLKQKLTGTHGIYVTSSNGVNVRSIRFIEDVKGKTILTPVATQQRRMWTGHDSYNTADWVYASDELTHTGRVLYARFASNDLSGSCIKKATIKFDGRTAESARTALMSVISLPDTLGLKVETTLTSLSATKKVTTAAKSALSDKLMTGTNGKYLDSVSSAIVASAKVVSDDETTTEDTGTYNLTHPFSMELDVTNATREAFIAGNHVQFALIAAKDVFTSENENVFEIENFANFADGNLYDANGNVLKTTDKTLKLDTSKTVCGSYSYYKDGTHSGTATDEYFAGYHIVKPSIILEIEFDEEQNVYENFKKKVTNSEDLENNIASIVSLLDKDAYDSYQKLNGEENINELLYDALIECELIAEFKQQFSEIVNEVYWKGYELRLDVVTDLGGARGKILADGATIPTEAYALVEVYDDNDLLTKKFTVNVKEGTGYYNVYNDCAAKVNITLCSDVEGTQPIAAEKSITVNELNIPEIFITEIANSIPPTFVPNAAHANLQHFQFVELYNYGDTAVDLSEYTFVYSADTENEFEWIMEADGSYIVNPGQKYIIGVYSKDSADQGYKYDTEEELLKYWEGFNDFYSVDIPVTNRVLIACVESGDGETLLEGISIDELLISGTDGTLFTAQMCKNGEAVTKASLPYSSGSGSRSYNFMPSVVGNDEETFLFCTGGFPYDLLDEQNFDYCEKAYFDENGKTKVMTYNILATNDAGYSVADRKPMVLKTIESFDPDLIGFQEVNYLWVDAFKAGMLSDYSCVEGISRNGYTYDNISTAIWDLINPIYYRTEKYNLIDSGASFLTKEGKINSERWDNTDMERTMTWVVLEDKETKEIVCYVNTHLATSGKVARVEQTKMVEAKAKELKETYGGGIIITGDHNYRENTEGYQVYTNGNVVADSRYLTTNHAMGITYAGDIKSINIEIQPYGTPLDYCFVSPEDFFVQKYDILNGAYPEGFASDHLAVCVELLDKDLITEHKNELISYDAEDKSVFAEITAGKEYNVIFVDYENEVLTNVDIVPVKTNNDCYLWVNQNKTDFALGKDDKVFVWERDMKPANLPLDITE